MSLAEAIHYNFNLIFILPSSGYDISWQALEQSQPFGNDQYVSIKVNVTKLLSVVAVHQVAPP